MFGESLSSTSRLAIDLGRLVDKVALDDCLKRVGESRNVTIALIGRMSGKIIRFPRIESQPYFSKNPNRSEFASFERETLPLCEVAGRRVGYWYASHISSRTTYLFVPCVVDSLLVGMVCLIDSGPGQAMDVADLVEQIAPARARLDSLLRPGIRLERGIAIADSLRKFSENSSMKLNEAYLGSEFTLETVLREPLREIARDCGFRFLAVLDVGSLAGRSPAVFGASGRSDTWYQDVSGLLDVIQLSGVEGNPATRIQTVSNRTESGRNATRLLRSAFALKGVSRFFVRTVFKVSRSNYLLIAVPMPPSSVPSGTGILTGSRILIDELGNELRHVLSVFQAFRTLMEAIPNTIHRIKSTMQILTNRTGLAKNRILRDPQAPLKHLVEDLESIERAIYYQGIQAQSYMYFATADLVDLEERYDKRKARIGVVLDEIVELFEAKELRRGVQFAEPNIDIAAVSEDTIIDKEYLAIIFEALIDNAVKYSFTGKTIQISLMKTIVNGAYKWCFEVSNFGLRIHDDEIDRIFEPFYRGRKIRDPKRNIPGSGIGLSIVKKIVEDWNGSVEVECRSRQITERLIRDPNARRPEDTSAGYRILFRVLLPA